MSMVFRRFHDPDISLPVIARTLGQEILEFLGEGVDILNSRGWSVVYRRSCQPRESTYFSAVARLRKQGLLAAIVPGKHGILDLTDEGRKKTPDYFRPAGFWNRDWDQRWYVLLYDVPELHRKYRNTLFAFLKRRRMGRLQKSVWITPDDIRPLYVDLQNAAGLRDYAILLESRTVMREGTESIVYEAWPMERLRTIQNHYLRIYTENLQVLEKIPIPASTLIEQARDELAAYAAAMCEDPLLPNPLLPADYFGKKVYTLHTQWIKSLAQILQNAPNDLV